MPCKGKFFPGRGFSSGAIFAKKWGLEMFWGKCLKIIDLLTMSSLYKCFCKAKKGQDFYSPGSKSIGHYFHPYFDANQRGIKQEYIYTNDIQETFL